MKLDRRQLRKMILREMRLLEGSSHLHAHKGSAMDQLVQRKVLDAENCSGRPIDEVIFGIGATKEDALADLQQAAESNPMIGNSSRMGGNSDTSPEVNHQISTPEGNLHVIVNQLCLDFDSVEVPDF